MVDNSHKARELEKVVRLDTYPLAVKLLESEKDIPEEAKRPVRDFGHHLSLCQVFSMSRREGTAIAVLKEDMWCFEPVLAFGLEKPPVRFLEGHNRFPQDVETLQAGANYAQNSPCLEIGKYIGIMSAPLETAAFYPDMVMMYCTSAQLSLLLLGIAYKDGFDLDCTLSGHAACVYSVVPVLQTGKCQVAVPCRGDRYVAGAQDGELIFSVPYERLNDLVDGLKAIAKVGTMVPGGVVMQPEYRLPESYIDLGREIGMDQLGD
ncbi:MAG: DUF169 domain-containing protein [Candidatus Bipolaricaulota bacterium]